MIATAQQSRIHAIIPLQRSEVWTPGGNSPAILLSPLVVNQPFRNMYFLRGSPILFGITRSGNVYSMYASVAGTEFFVGSATLTGVDIKPTEIRFGNEMMDNAEGMEWFGGKVDEATALTQSQVLASLRSLDFFPQL